MPEALQKQGDFPAWSGSFAMGTDDIDLVSADMLVDSSGKIVLRVGPFGGAPMDLFVGTGSITGSVLTLHATHYRVAADGTVTQSPAEVVATQVPGSYFGTRSFKLSVEITSPLPLARTQLDMPPRGYLANGAQLATAGGSWGGMHIHSLTGEVSGRQGDCDIRGWVTVTDPLVDIYRMNALFDGAGCSRPGEGEFLGYFNGSLHPGGSTELAFTGVVAGRPARLPE